jgi:hypothetical protein
MEYNLGELLAKDPTTLSTEELTFIVNFEKTMRAARKVAVEKGVVAKKAEKTELSPEVQLLATAFEAVITANADVIKGLFPVSAGKPNGAKGYSIATSKECPFYIQILNRSAFEAEAKDKKNERLVAGEKKELATLLATAELNDDQKKRLAVLQEKYPVVPEPTPEPTI